MRRHMATKAENNPRSGMRSGLDHVSGADFSRWIRRALTALVVVMLLDATAWGGTNTFVPVGSLKTARYLHTVTLLPDGKVLVAGGYGGNSSAELFDPATHQFTATGGMLAEHGNHTATLLANGEVLIVGGGVNKAERYNPASGKFTATGSMRYYRNGSTATLLPNGKVLITGGDQGQLMTCLDKAELYDPATGLFTATGSMTTTRAEHSATLLPDGTVLIIGGHSGGRGGGAQADLYNPATGKFTATGAMGTARFRHRATLLPNGKVLVTGGQRADIPYGPSLATAEVYDPATGKFEATGSSATPRCGHTATLLPNGAVLVAGGETMRTWDIASAELYDPATGTFKAVSGTMSTTRSRHAATILADGRVLLVGGFNGVGLAGADLYDSAAGGVTFSKTATNDGRMDHRSVMLPDGKVMIIGGLDALHTTELYDSITDKHTVSAPMVVGRGMQICNLLHNGKVLAAGGRCDLRGQGKFPTCDWTETAELYDTATGIWSATGSMNDSRSIAQSALLPNGKVLVVGGEAESKSPHASAELYDPEKGTWTLTGSMAVGRAEPRVTPLLNGKILITGGRGGGKWPQEPYVSKAELYDPDTGLFTPSGSMTIGRCYHTATLLPDGKVLVAGGGTAPETYASFTKSAELYDPATGLFTPTGSMSHGRIYHRAILLPNGKALVVGGGYNIGIPEAELYDPATGTWSIAGNIQVTRERPSLTLLLNGKVLIAGVSSKCKSEIYDPGLGFAESRRPVISSFTLEGSSLKISGSNFNGGTEGSGSFPLVTLRELDGERIYHVVVHPAFSWSASALTSALPADLPCGRYLLTVTANGVPSLGHNLSHFRRK